ncbi:MAG: hypothetical protein GXN92_00055 [Candidatus Micrarchaeota archaeon]|nr:hypothetical protein [Candidatus Micrarchaeota archaeon]
MRRIIALAVLIFLSGCISLNIPDNLNSSKCDYLLANSQDVRLITSCYQEQAMLYAAIGETGKAVQSCEKLLLVRVGEINTTKIGTILTMPLNVIYDAVYPVWLYRNCVISVAKTARDPGVCNYINKWDSKLYADYTDLYNELVNLFQTGAGITLGGPGGLVDYLWPGYTAKDCVNEVKALQKRDELAEKSLFDIISS